MTEERMDEIVKDLKKLSGKISTRCVYLNDIETKEIASRLLAAEMIREGLDAIKSKLYD